ncbi:hypothetical protein [Saccharothrix obliqua]|uniref:hypothetical protein n=1 Tax=Saccharothrix obliqua TaxID=2861747 RepID=UPI001C5E152B|nr:hypothetical protein [Saccharothrix obliqua]MBW4720082.1 hypothetical protein [Saccharothrix obliqua]
MIVGVIGLVLVGHFVLWRELIPAVGVVVAPVPVVSTVVGWLFAGAAFGVVGVLLINQRSARPEVLSRLRWTAGIWSLVALMCVPTGAADEVVLPVDFWAGVFAGAYGVVMSPVAAIVVGLVWSLVLKLRPGEPTGRAVGWAFVGYSALLLVWGSTLLRM